VTRLRTLAACRIAAERLGLDPWMGAGDLLFSCPICRDAGLKALVCIRDLRFGRISVSCRGCELWGDDPKDVIGSLKLNEGADATPATDYAEGRLTIPLAVFHLLWAMHKQREL
jgi:hypothetical protein